MITLRKQEQEAFFFFSKISFQHWHCILKIGLESFLANWLILCSSQQSLQSASCPAQGVALATLSDRATPPLIPTINALTLRDFKHDCLTIGMFSNPTIPSTIRSEKLSKSRWCPIHVSTPPSKSLYVLSICKTWVQIYLFGRATVIFKHHLVSGEG